MAVAVSMSTNIADSVRLLPTTNLPWGVHTQISDVSQQGPLAPAMPIFPLNANFFAQKWIKVYYPDVS